MRAGKQEGYAETNEWGASWTFASMPLTKDHYRMEGRTEMHNSQDLQKVLELRDAILGGNEKRLKEQQERAAREALVLGGNSFFRLLWDVACKKRTLPPQPGEDTRGISEWPAPEVAERLKQILFARMADPESQECDELWRMLSKGLPDVPHLPVQLLMAWEQVPAHYNFWYDRAGYAPGDDWWQPLAPAVEALQRAAREVELPVCDLPFISIDSATTRDVDDAFHILPTDDGGFDLTLALACPAHFASAMTSSAVFTRITLCHASGIVFPSFPPSRSHASSAKEMAEASFLSSSREKLFTSHWRSWVASTT